MFFNELDILEGRLEYLYNYVDKFVIVESNITHSGLSKPFNFQNNIERYQKYLDKIIYYPLEISADEYNFDLDPKKLETRTSAQWQIENRQRNYIAELLTDFNPYDIALISDVDEIPSRHIIKSISKLISIQRPVVSLIQDMFYYNLNQKQINPWTGTVASTIKFIKDNSPQFCRDNREAFYKIDNGGWHLSYWGDIKHIQEKLKSFAHQEWNTEQYTNDEYIQQQITQGQDLFNRNYNPFVKVDISTLNKDIVKIFGK
jgi:beta-1,4-mannosyl-glycoprotein beta-1,4-N-acetylglucosaminyltransferase